MPYTATDKADALKIGSVHFGFSKTPGTALPTDPSAPGTGWTLIGYSDADEVLTMNIDGGDKTTLAAAQDPNFMVDVAPKTYGFTVNALQLNVQNFGLWGGSNAVVNGTTSIDISDTPIATTGAFFAALVLAPGKYLMFSCKSADFLGKDAPKIGKRGELATLPIEITANRLTATDDKVLRVSWVTVSGN